MEKTIVVLISANVRIISTVKGKELSPNEFIQIEFSVPEWVILHDIVIRSMGDAETRSNYVDRFKQRLQSNSDLKHFIGRTRWSVDVLKLSYVVTTQSSTDETTTA